MSIDWATVGFSDVLATVSSIMLVLLAFQRWNKPFINKEDIKVSFEILEMVPPESEDYKRVRRTLDQEMRYIYPTEEEWNKQHDRSVRRFVFFIGLIILGWAFYSFKTTGEWGWIKLTFVALCFSAPFLSDTKTECDKTQGTQNADTLDVDADEGGTDKK